MAIKGIGPQGLGNKGNNGFWVGDGSTKGINSPAKKTVKIEPIKLKTDTQDITEKAKSKQYLNKEGKAETKYYRGGLEVSPDETNFLKNREKQKATHKRQDNERNEPNATVQSLMDPTGISQWGGAKRAAVDLAKMTGSAMGLKSQRGYDWNSSRAIGDAFDMAGAIPLIGKYKAVKEGMKMVKSSRPFVSKLAKKLIAHAIPTTGVAATNQYNKSKESKNTANKSAVKSPAKKTVKDACYNKVKASYDVFPSAYASGAIAKCRKGKG